ncbi:MAG: FHA domain-containing serine/threonine-protein kinase [Bryobacteraceae bacterium]
MASPGNLSRIGRYELQTYLGGGMSQVYKAWDPAMNRLVAVKLLPAELAADSETRARFAREAQTAGGMVHDNVLRVYDYGEDQGRPFLVMEFVQGEQLDHLIRERRLTSLRRKLEIALQIAKGAEHIHAHGIVHRDLKPQNIHVDASGRVRLMDFGIAKTKGSTLTRPGYTLGSPYYMSPEQVLGSDVTHLADVYSFGVLLYEMFAGLRPFTATSVEQLFEIIRERPVNLEPLGQAAVPEPLRRLVAQCLAKDPQARPQSFTLIREQLEQLLGAANAWLEVLFDPRKGERLALPDQIRFTIGRSADQDLALKEDRRISRHHAVISKDLVRGFMLLNIGPNGTFVNARRIHDAVVLHDGDKIGFGSPEPRLVFHEKS